MKNKHGERPHLLVVDDDDGIAALFDAYLSANGYRVTAAGDGHAALLADEKDPVDAVITDLTMPGMDGTELVERLRARRPGLPAIIVSGYAGDERSDSSTTLVLVKPVSLALLAQHLARLMFGNG